MTNAIPHPFASTVDAYDQTQCNPAIRVGDTLLIASEQVVGLSWAWPVAVTAQAGDLHEMAEAESAVADVIRSAGWSPDQIRAAVEVADAQGFTVAEWARAAVGASPSQSAVLAGESAVPLADEMSDLAHSIGAVRAQKAIQELAGAESADPCLEGTLEKAIALGYSADRLAAAIWGQGWSWEQILASYARGEAGFQAVLQDAGYSIVDTGGGCVAASKTVDGVLFLVTDMSGARLGNPDFWCLVGAYEPETLDYLHVTEDFDGLAKVEQVLPILATRALEQN
ncbi:hypothetical protein [Stutzerimonas stutzeri]|uniref:hypothetical protein n=1 Tax=Stutzerimonas stutzeri TaxID=316 RepID=UPI001BCE04C3|nr:hypothetical protein [Stutzerimonas stutzeri]